MLTLSVEMPLVLHCYVDASYSVHREMVKAILEDTPLYDVEQFEHHRVNKISSPKGRRRQKLWVSLPGMARVNSVLGKPPSVVRWG